VPTPVPEKGAAMPPSISEDDFGVGVARLELLHRLRKAAAAVARPAAARGGLALAASTRDGSIANAALRKSWPAAKGASFPDAGARLRGGLQGRRQGGAASASLDKAHVDSRHNEILEVLIGCPACIPAPVRAKFVEFVCQYPQDQTHALLLRVERERARRDEAGNDTAWPEFDGDVDARYDASESSPAREMSASGIQAVSIFRSLDIEASGVITEASLVRGLSSWLIAASRPDEEGRQGAAPDSSTPAAGVAPPQSAGERAEDRPVLASVPEEPAGIKRASEPDDAAVAAAGPKTEPAAADEAGLLRALKIDVKMDKKVAKQLAAMRQEDMRILEGKLKEVQEVHADAAARVERLRQREEALRRQEAAAKQAQVWAEERERQLQERDKAIAEREENTAMLRAEILQKAHELEETARSLQQRKAAVEHREKMLEQQMAHVKQLQALAAQTLQQHDEDHKDATQRDAASNPATGSRPLEAIGASDKLAPHSSRGQTRRAARGGGRGAVGQGRGLQREKDLQALAVLLQSERDGYFRQLQSVERLVNTFEGLPNTPEPLLDALKGALYTES
jgi:hypothetical protein